MAIERREIVRRWKEGTSGVLVTLVAAIGSSYRRRGARLLVAALGMPRNEGVTGREGASRELTGSISGGCLEADLVRRAEWLTESGAVVEHYSTAFDDTAEIPFGLGCGGELECLLERSGTPEYEALLRAMERSLHGEASTVITRLPGRGIPLSRAVLVDGALRWKSDGGDAPWLDLARGDPQALEAEGVFLERLDAPQRLWVLGAGDDAKPLVRFAGLLGWSVLVADGRSQLARKERFAEAETTMVVRADSPLPVRREDAVVLMTHSYEQDRELLRTVLPIGPRYLGLLGSRHRSSLLVSEVAEMLGWTLERCCAGLHAPVGLDLGGDGPEAVALAVVAEVQACCHGRIALLRALSVDEVRAQLADGSRGRYLQTQCSLDVSL